MNDNKQKAFDIIKGLIEKFENNYNQYNDPNYNETMTRRDFIDPFFEALGWDVANKQGFSETYREVIHEDKLRIKSSKNDVLRCKAPDYAFRIGGSRVFFVEAKKPSVKLDHNPETAFQLRRYGYSASLGISILSDFEEFAIYDCSVKPNINDKSSVARIKYFNYKDFLIEENFDFLYNTFYKENVLKGSLEKYINNTKAKKGTSSVDSDFLSSLDSLRTKLADNINKLNKNLSVRDLNFAVQAIIDRIIFLRVAEDRNVEEYGRLRVICEKKGEDFYPKLIEIFREADRKYNSGLFHLEEDHITTNLTIENKVIKSIIEELYYPISPYEFSVISVEIIGNAYEQFLGKTISINNRNKAVIDFKPEVRKAGGVYYTPEYIVSYIVRNTVGAMIEGKSPEEIAKIKIIDPACGSGSFLLGVYEYLLSYHLEYYKSKKQNTKFRGVKDDVLNESGEGLSLWLKKRILVNNIFGVDIDANAVEVSKLSLLLKCLEGETQASLMNNASLFGERALPSLEDNIKCGNSLIGSDFYHNEEMLLLDEDMQYRINCFDFEAEFKQVFQNGGFDCVVGNPPYIQLQGMEKEFKVGYQSGNYKTYHSMGDIYQLFFEKGLNIINDNGIVGFIVSNKWMRAGYGEKTREYFYYNANNVQVVDLGAGRFKGATVDTNIIFYGKNKQKQIDEKRVFLAEKFYDDLENLHTLTELKNNIVAYQNKEWVIMNKIENEIFEKFQKHKPLKDWDITINYGVKTGFNEAFIIDEETKNRLIEEDKKSEELIKPLIRGRDIKRYSYNFANIYLINTHNGIKEKGIHPTDIKDYPTIKRHLDKYYKQLEKRQDKGITPYNLRNCAYLEEFEKDKIVWTPVNGVYSFAFVEAGYYFNNSIFMITDRNNDIDKLKYLLAVLNTVTVKLGSLITPLTNVGKYAYGSKEFMQNIPIPETSKENQDKLVKLVDHIINLKKKLIQIKNPNESKITQRRIEAIEKQIDAIVYSLYNLTEDEIKIVENS